MNEEDKLFYTTDKFVDTPRMTRSLLSLPAELQFEIVKAVSHKDLLNFSLTCKNLYQLAKGRMAEHKDWSKYGRNGRFYFRITSIPKYIMHPTTIHGFQVFITNYPPFPHVEERPLTLIHELLTFIYHNPQFSRHIESLEEDSHETGSNFHNAGSAVAIDTELINRLLKSCKFIESGERDDWKRSIDIGQRGASPALLFAQLPNLKHLFMEIRLSDLLAPYISKMIMRCAAKAYMGYIDQPLSSLRSAKICWPSEDDSRHIPEVRDSYNKGSLILLQSLTLLPLFKELHIHSYHTDFDFFKHNMFEEMDLLHLDNFDPNKGFFNEPSALRSLKLTHSPLYVPKLTTIIEIIKILQARLLPLKSLHIVADTDTLPNCHRRWNVEGLTSLTHLTINTKFLPVRAPGVCEALIDVLPQSVQCVDIIYSGVFPSFRFLSFWDDIERLNERDHDSYHFRMRGHVCEFRKSLLNAGFKENEIHRFDLPERGHFSGFNPGFAESAQHPGMEEMRVYGRNENGILGEKEGHFVIGFFIQQADDMGSPQTSFHGVSVERT